MDFNAQRHPSDAIAISTKVTLGGLWRMLYSLERLTLEPLAEGYFARGALVRGRLYHDETMAFGDALIKAYSLENNVVRFPRDDAHKSGGSRHRWVFKNRAIPGGAIE